MEHGEYLDHLLLIGMGWLGWTEQQTLETSMPAVLLAHDGRIDMLQAIFGNGEAAAARPADEPPRQERLAPEAEKPLADRLLSAFRSLKGQRKKGHL